LQMSSIRGFQSSESSLSCMEAFRGSTMVQAKSSEANGEC
jgi:hypothetical protein